MPHTWPAEQVLVAHKSPQWLKVVDVLLVINLEDTVQPPNGSEITLTYVAPGWVVWPVFSQCLQCASPGESASFTLKLELKLLQGLSPSWLLLPILPGARKPSGISEPSLRSVFCSPTEKPVSAEWRFTFPRGAPRGRGEVTGLPAEKPTETVAWILSFPWARKWDSSCVQNCSYFHGDTFFSIMYWRTLVKLNSIQISIHISLQSFCFF